MSRAPRTPPEGDDGLDEHDPYDLPAATIEHYRDAALYDFEYRRRRADVNHYRELARAHAQDGAVLELGCGTGRILAPLARDGHTAIGVDVAPDMLARAAERIAGLGRAARARVHLVRADMRRFAFATRFPLVICPFNAFQHMYARADAEATLASVRAHLSPGGIFAFDVLNPDLRWLTRNATKRWARTKFTHPTSGRRYEYSTNQTYDPITQIAYMRIYYEALDEDPATRRTHVVRLAQRQFFPAELAALLANAGFTVVERWGDFGRAPLTGDAPSQVVVCRARA